MGRKCALMLVHRFAGDSAEERVRRIRDIVRRIGGGGR